MKINNSLNQYVLVKITKKLLKYFLLVHIVFFLVSMTADAQSKETRQRTEKSLEVKRKQRREYDKSRDAEVKRRYKMQNKETRQRMKKTRKDAEAFNKRKGKSKFNNRKNKPKITNSRKNR